MTSMFDAGRNLDALGKSITATHSSTAEKPRGYSDLLLEKAPGPIGPLYKGYNDVTSGASTTTLIADASSLMSACMDMREIATDPIGWLIGQGLGFLMNVVTPIKAAIDLVSGNPEALSAAAAQYGKIGKDLASFADDLIADMNAMLGSWVGAAGEAAQAKLAEFAAGVRGVAGQSGDIAQMLQICSMIMQIVEDFIKGLLTDLIKWLIITWIAALASAPVTFGGSTAAAGAATTVKTASTAAKAAQTTSKLSKLLDKVRELISKIQNFLRSAPTKFMDKQGHQAFADLRTAGARADFGGLVATKVGESAKKRGLETVGLASGDDGIKVDGPKVVGKVASHAENIGKAGKYGDIGTEPSESDIRRSMSFE